MEFKDETAADITQSSIGEQLFDALEASKLDNYAAIVSASC